MRIKKGVVPKDFQKVGIDFLFNSKYALLADEMGLGKTFQAIMAAAITGNQTLIVCPSNLKVNWVGELHKFLEDFSYLVIHNAKDVDKITFNEDFIICSYKRLEHIPFTMELTNTWVFDEAHYLKNPKSGRARNVIEMIKTGTRPEYLFLLTGTPITNRIPDLWSAMYMCSFADDLKGIDVRKYFPNWYKWCQYFCVVNTTDIRTKRGVKKVTNYGKLKETRLPELHKVMEGKVLRRKADQVLKLHDIVRRDIVINESINKKLQEAFDNPDKASSMEVKEQNAYAKVRATLSYIKQLVEEVEGPILVFSDHIGSTQKIGDGLIKLGYTVGTITGQTAQKLRQKNVDRFTTGELDFLVATIGTTSTGYTFVNCNHIIMNDFSWNPSDNAQAEKRIHRIGQDKICFIHRIIGDATDQRILKTIESKQVDIDRVLKEN